MTEAEQDQEAFAFNVGDPVCKPKGYPFNGFVVAAFHTSEGFARYVVEHATETGMLHIYSRAQLQLRLAHLEATSMTKDTLKAIVERVARALCRVFDAQEVEDGRQGGAMIAYDAASFAKPFWDKMALAALNASGLDEAIEALEPFAEAERLAREQFNGKVGGVTLAILSRVAAYYIEWGHLVGARITLAKLRGEWWP